MHVNACLCQCAGEQAHMLSLKWRSDILGNMFNFYTDEKLRIPDTGINVLQNVFSLLGLSNIYISHHDLKKNL